MEFPRKLKRIISYEIRVKNHPSVTKHNAFIWETHTHLHDVWILQTWTEQKVSRHHFFESFVRKTQVLLVWQKRETKQEWLKNKHSWRYGRNEFRYLSEENNKTQQRTQLKVYLDNTFYFQTRGLITTTLGTTEKILRW